MATKSTAKKSTTKRKSAAKKPPAKKPAVVKKNVSAKAANTKSVSKKAPAKSSAAKSVSASKSAAVTGADITRRITITPIERLRGIHFSNIFTSIILIILTYVFVKAAKIPVLLNYQAKDTFTITDHTTLSNATEVLTNIDLRHLLVAVLGLTAIASLIMSSRLFGRYQSTIKAGISGYRWLLYGIVTAVLVAVVSLMAGVQDLATLKLAGILALVSSIFGWMSERENAGAKKPHKLGFWASTLTMLAAHLPMLGSLLSVGIIGGERFSWYVYAAVAVMVISWLANTMTLKASIDKRDRYEYVTFEQRYVRIDQIAKFLIVLIIFAAFSK